MDNVRILIVEDDPIIAADLEDRLLEMGYHVLGPVASGEEALTFFPKNIPDLVLMDIQLEGQLDGIETVERILKKHLLLPIVFLTSNSDDATFARARTTLPAAFLTKPFRGKDLRNTIELAISRGAHTAPKPEATDVEINTGYLFDDRLFLKMKDRMIRLFFKDILWVEADDYYCKVVTASKEHLVGQTLKQLSETLAGVPELMRVHRSYLVNISHVEEIGDLYVLIGKQKIPLNKVSKDELVARLQKI